MRTQVEIGQDATVYCTDGPIGTVRQVVVDERHGDLTDLVVECEDGEWLVVPVTMVTHADGRTVALKLSHTMLRGMERSISRYQPAAYHPYVEQSPCANRDERTLPTMATEPLATTEGEARGETLVAGDAPSVPAAPLPATIDTTIPAMLRPFTEGVLRLPLGGEQLSAERQTVVSAEVIVRKVRRSETVTLRGVTRKERVEIDESRAARDK